MKNKFIIRLLLLVAVSISLYSCVHDEISSSSDTSSKEYQSKSLWKEDVKYIKNVMKIYQENEAKIKTTSGIPLWEYAMTMGNMDESFLIVPIKEGDKIISVLSVPRIEDKVYFNYSDKAEYVNFFQKYIDAPIKKVLNTETSSSASRYSCTTQTVSVWYPNNESNPDSGGHWGSVQITNCVPVKELSGCYKDVFGNCVNDGGGYPYPGDGGGGSDPQDPEPPEDPCTKTKNALNKPNVQQGITDVKAQALKTLSNVYEGEIGFKEPKSGGAPIPADVNEKHKVVFNNVTDSYGGYHNHTAEGTHMFSPPDIQTLLGFAAAQSVQDGVGSAYFGMIAAEWCSSCPPDNKEFLHYVIQYTGAASDLGIGGNHVYTDAEMNQFIDDYQEIVDNLKSKSKSGTTYIKNSGDLNEKGLEKLFFNTLKIMKLDGEVNLQRVTVNGIINNVTLNSNGMPIGTPCPN